MELGKELDKLGVLCIPQFEICISILETEIAFAIFLIENQLEKQYKITYSSKNREGSNRKGFGSRLLPRQWLVWQL